MTPPDYTPALAALGHAVQAGQSTLNRLLADGLIPVPSKQTVAIHWYTEQQIDEVRRLLDGMVRLPTTVIRPEPLVSLNEIARRAGVAGSVAQRAVHLGFCPKPTHRINVHMRYTETEAEQIVQAVRAYASRPRTGDQQPPSVQEQRKAQGLASRSEVARSNGVAPVTHAWHESQGRIMAPTHTHPGCVGRFYDLDDQAKIREFYQSRPRLAQHGADRRHARGLRSRTDLARAAGISRPALCAMIVAGRVPAPTEPSGHGDAQRYYRAGEQFDVAVEGVRRAMTDMRRATQVHAG